MHKVVFLSIIALIFYCVIPPQALNEDLLMYFTKFDLNSLDFNISGIYDLIIEEDNPNISLQGFHFIPVLFYNYLAYLPFELFIFINIFILVLLYAFVINRYLNNRNFLNYGLILSPAMLICTSYTWRQSLSLLLALAIFNKSISINKICLLIFITIFIHPISVILLLITLIQYFYIKNCNTLYLIISIFAGSITAYIFDYYGPFKNNFEEPINMLNIKINILAWFVFSLYFLAIYFKNLKNIDDGISAIFLLAFIMTFFLINQSPVAASRIYGAISIIASLAVIKNSYFYMNKFIAINIMALLTLLFILNI
jgi:hypothetical protein